MSRTSGWAFIAALFAFVLLVGSGAFAADDIEQKAQICATCHGADGVPINTATPVIWGQDEGYLYLQLRDFQKGTRKSPLMESVVAQLEKQDMYDLAAYFTKKKWPNLGQAPASSAIAAKAETAARSIGCRGCHLEHFQGDGTTARLAGQWQEYLLSQMLAFRDGSRGNNPGMSDLMKATPEEDFEPLAKYLAGLQIDQYIGRGGR